MSDAAAVETQAPAQSIPVPSGDILSTLTNDQRAAWLKTGDLPSPAEPASAADGEPTEPPAGTTERAAPVDPAKPGTGKPRTDINARLGQLAEQKRLATERADKAERELAELRSGRPAPQTQAPVQQAAPQTQALTHLDLVKYYQQDPAWPTIEQAQAAGFEDAYQAASNAQSAFIQQREMERAQMNASIHAQRTREQARIDKAFADARALPGFNEAAITDIPVTPAFARALFESDSSGALLNYFSEHPAEGRAIAAMEPLSAARALGKIEAQLSVVTSTPATPPSKTVSSAPDPIQTLGARHTAGPGDEVEDAIRSNDVSRYIRLENERELQAIRGGRR